MRPASFENARDFFRRDEWPRRIVHTDKLVLWIDIVQAGAHGVLTLCAARHDFFYFRLRLKEFAQFRQSIVAPDQNNFRDAFRALKSVDGVGNDRFPGERREKFVEPHSLAAAGRNDDYC